MLNSLVPAGLRTGDLVVLALLLAPARLDAGTAHPGLPPQSVHEAWGSKDGLPEGPVLALLPARDGYLWLGMPAGLVRFDGARFHVFEPGERGLGSVSFGRRILQTEDDAIWAALVGGVARFSGGRFQTFSQPQGLEHPFVYALVPGTGGSLWAGTGGSGVWRLREGLFSRHPAYSPPGLPSQVNDLALDRSGTLWAATGEGLLALGDTVRLYGVRDGLPAAVANTLQADPDGGLWVGTPAGLAELSEGRFRTFTTRDGLASNDVTALALDEGSLWIGTRTAGLHRMRGGSIERVGDAASADTGVLSLARDAAGTLWVGTDRGLERYERVLFRSFGREAGLGDERILNVTAHAGGGVWALDGAGGLALLDAEGGRTVAPAGSVVGQGMVPLAEGPDASLWVGGPQLRRFREGRWQSYANPGGDFTVLLPERDSLLVAQTRGDGTSTLARLGADGRFRPQPVGVPLVHVQRLWRDRSGRLWISTGGAGLVRLDHDGGVRVFRSADGLPHDTVYGLAEDAAGDIWAGTRAGLVRIRGDQVASLAAFQDTPRRAPLHLACDAQGRLWAAAEDGIHVLKLSALDALVEGRASEAPVRRYSSGDGLRSVEFSWRSPGFAQGDDGRLWFATSRGVSVVDPREVPLDPQPPPVVVEEVLLGRRSADLLQPVRVPAADRERITIRFTAPTTRAPEQLCFRYRLLGYQDGWIETHGARVASFTNVPPGAYTLEVAARRSDGPWARTPALLKLEVDPRWHETLPARAAFFAAIGLALLGVHRLRLRQAHHRQRTLARLVEGRTLELQQEISERRRAEQAVRELNSELESRVRERTAQLEVANAALADEKERLVVTVGSLAEGVVTTDVAGRVVLMNPVAERLTGWGAPVAAGRPLAEVCRLLDRFERRPLEDPAARVLGSGHGAPQALTRAALLSATGGEVLVEASAAPIEDAEGRVAGAVVVLRDVTEKTLAEEQIQKVQKLEALGVLAGGIAHDFNNLLTGIFGQIDLARAELAQTRAAHRLESALEVLDNARALTRQLLTFSAGGRPATESHAVGELLRRSARFVLSGKGLPLELDLPEDLWPCDVDPLQIRQAIDNLLLNAVQAMPGGGRVEIRARNVVLAGGEAPEVVDGRYVEITIADQGTGIAPEIRDRVFEPFFTTKQAGTGLGLATVHSIVTQHGGSVRFDSLPGRGTTFRVLLRAADVAPAATNAALPAAPRAACVRARVLVMDDEPVLLEIARAALEADGHCVEVAAGGGEAIAVFERWLRDGRPFQLAILDLTIVGGLGGVETLRRLRELVPSLKAIATSGYSDDPVLADPRRFGFDGTLPKPYALSDMTAVVDSVLAGSGEPADRHDRQ